MKTTTGSRILMLLENQSYPRDVRVRQEATALVAAGHTVSVICPRRGKQPWRETIDHVHVYRFPAPPDANGFVGYAVEYGYATLAAFILSLVVFFRRGFDIVHAHNPPDTFVLIAALYKVLGKRFVFDHHDLAPEMYYARFRNGGSRLVHRVLLVLEGLSHRLADHVIVTNESYKAIALGRGKVPENKVTVVRNGPDLSRLPVIRTHPNGRNPDTIMVGYVGVMGVQDGVDYLLRALGHLVHDLKRTNVCCKLVGDGDALPDLQQLSSQLKLDDYVDFVGWVDSSEVHDIINEMDICAAPEPSNDYNDRSTVIKMMEYMALAKPIVAFALPEHQATAGPAAVYATANDEHRFAQKIALLMDDPQQRKEMGRIGRERIEKELAWVYQAHRLVEAYDTVATR